MSIKFNDQLLLWGLGVIQPASPAECVEFLRLVYPDVEQWPDKYLLNKIFEEWMVRRYVIRLNKKHQLYSLASAANSRMDVKLRRQRDKARLTLLREIYDANLDMSEAVEKDLDGVSPSTETRLTTQDGSRPVKSGPKPSRTESTRLSSRFYWPRVSEQLNYKVGLNFHASDIPSYRYRYCSFPNLTSLQHASSDISLEHDMTLSQLALAIGVSPRLLTSFTHKPENHYRIFFIKKKGGGERQIASPRFFLKTIHYWIKTYIFCQLKIHGSCHAYRSGKSIITNAENHVKKLYVANIDIQDFFGNITRNHIFRLLRKNEVGEKLANTIADLTTYHGSLPQGAPTSPILSNAFLYEFDENLTDVSRNADLHYTRYADDITISGNSLSKIEMVINNCRALLSDYNLNLKDEKKRIASNKSSQRVTGLIVNEKIQPPREYQRKVRSMFHNADRTPERYIERIDELRGHISYLSSFDVLRDSRHLVRYRLVIKKLTSISKKNTKTPL